MKRLKRRFREMGVLTRLQLVVATVLLLIATVPVGPALAKNDRLVKPAVAERINKAWKAYRNQKPDKAVRLIRPLTSRTDLPPDVYLLAGKIFYDKNRFNRAIEQFRSGLRKSNNPKLRQQARDFIERSRNLDQLNLTSRIFNHFIVLTAPGLPGDVPSKINQDLSKAYRRIGGDLDLFPERQFTVIIYKEPQFRQVIEAPGWSGGVFDGKIHIPYRTESREPYTTRSLYHEYTHALLYHIARDNIPLWFNEGFATYQEYRQSRDQFRYRRLPDNPPEETIQNLEDISQLFKSKNDREEARLAYEYSYSFIKFLKKRYGMMTLKRLIQNTGKSSSFEKAVETTLNRSLNSLRFDWEGWLDREIK